MVRTTLAAEDEGKTVVNDDGTEVGRLVEVREGRGYVDPNPSITDTIKAKLGWGDVTDEAHPLDEGSIDRVTDDAVYLSGNL